MRPADNGVIIDFTEITPGATSGTFDEDTHHDRELVFKFEEMDVAMAKFKELAIRQTGHPMTIVVKEVVVANTAHLET